MVEAVNIMGTSIQSLQGKEKVKASVKGLVEAYEAEMIVDKRVSAVGTEYLVKWSGYASSDNTWEPAAHILDKGLIAAGRAVVIRAHFGDIHAQALVAQREGSGWVDARTGA